ncbi:trypsin-like serine peptidase [Actinoallomurus rhizosphaericola]|uniref:trypsin-like serine peptidase n=1 Tax=Actinoallomurus rhizosphaericola TaxID=2952536 RepID=UPI002091B23D|nr:peptidase [Actinoallomurus rhizosphaericola]MCO5992187.1 peptidase [Actinoallomurus rhizosphaericola]
MTKSPRLAAVSVLTGALLSVSPSASRAGTARPADGPPGPGVSGGATSDAVPGPGLRERSPGRTGEPDGRIGRADRPGGRPRLSPLPGRDAAGPAVHPMADSRTDRERLLRWWTPTRMRRARPLDGLVALAAARGLVPGGRPAETPASTPSTGAAWTSGGRVAQTIGRVFFLYAGRPASCSGDAVTSGNQSTVITAGHCVRLDGAWHTDWMFVPGYHDGQAPYGKWTAARTLTTPQWEAHEDLDYDVGAATVDPQEGRTLTSVVGGQGIAFNQPRRRPMYAFGYPAQAPYDGSRLVYCSGRAKDDTKSHDIGLTCDMTAGSSGGPWFLGFDARTGAGTQNSVNSFKYNADPNVMFGPYFGAAVKALYDKAQNT